MIAADIKSVRMQFLINLDHRFPNSLHQCLHFLLNKIKDSLGMSFWNNHGMSFCMRLYIKKSKNIFIFIDFIARDFSCNNFTKDTLFHFNIKYSNVYKLYLYREIMLVVRTQIKDILKESGLGVDNVAADFMVQIDEKAKQ